MTGRSWYRADCTGKFIGRTGADDAVHTTGKIAQRYALRLVWARFSNLAPIAAIPDLHTRPAEAVSVCQYCRDEATSSEATVCTACGGSLRWRLATGSPGATTYATHADAQQAARTAWEGAPFTQTRIDPAWVETGTLEGGETEWTQLGVNDATICDWRLVTSTTKGDVIYGELVGTAYFPDDPDEVPAAAGPVTDETVADLSAVPLVNSTGASLYAIGEPLVRGIGCLGMLFVLLAIFLLLVSLRALMIALGFGIGSAWFAVLVAVVVLGLLAASRGRNTGTIGLPVLLACALLLVLGATGSGSLGFFGVLLDGGVRLVRTTPWWFILPVLIVLGIAGMFTGARNRRSPLAGFTSSGSSVAGLLFALVPLVFLARACGTTRSIPNGLSRVAATITRYTTTTTVRTPSTVRQPVTDRLPPVATTSSMVHSGRRLVCSFDHGVPLAHSRGAMADLRAIDGEHGDLVASWHPREGTDALAAVRFHRGDPTQHEASYVVTRDDPVSAEGLARTSRHEIEIYQQNERQNADGTPNGAPAERVTTLVHVTQHTNALGILRDSGASLAWSNSGSPTWQYASDQPVAIAGAVQLGFGASPTAVVLVASRTGETGGELQAVQAPPWGAPDAPRTLDLAGTSVQPDAPLDALSLGGCWLVGWTTADALHELATATFDDRLQRIGDVVRVHREGAGVLGQPRFVADEGRVTLVAVETRGTAHRAMAFAGHCDVAR